MKPCQPGFYWYKWTTRDYSEDYTTWTEQVNVWCVVVENDYKGLSGWVPHMDYTDPIDSPNWERRGGEWVGQAIPPIPYDWPA